MIASSMEYLASAVLTGPANSSLDFGFVKLDQHTFTASEAPTGALSHAPLNAPSASPPLKSCLTCPAICLTSASDTSGSALWRVVMSKFWDDSGSRASMLMVRQFSVREAVVWDWIIDILGGCGVGFGEC